MNRSLIRSWTQRTLGMRAPLLLTAALAVLCSCHLLKASQPLAKAEPPTVVIDGTDTAAVSPYLFGFGSYGEKDREKAGVWRQRPTLVRFGGNTAERYNWKVNAYNAAND